MAPIDPDLVLSLKRPQYWVATRDKSEYDRRTIYMIYKRNLRLPFEEVFDAPGHAALLRAARAIDARSAGAGVAERADLERAGRGVRAAHLEGAHDAGGADRLRVPAGGGPLADGGREDAGNEISGREAERSGHR